MIIAISDFAKIHKYTTLTINNNDRRHRFSRDKNLVILSQELLKL